MEAKKVNSNIILIFILFLISVFIAYGIISALHIPKEEAPTLVCNYHLHQLNIARVLYHHEHKMWPSKDNWCDLAKPYIDEQDDRVFRCPADTTGPCSYAMNENIPADAEELPDDLVILFEAAPGWNQVGGADDVVTDRHKQPGANFAFADGHIEFVEADEIPNLRWTVDGSNHEQ